MHLIAIIILTALMFFLLGFVVAHACGSHRRVKEMEELDLRKLKPVGPDQQAQRPPHPNAEKPAPEYFDEPVKIIVNARLVACSYREISYAQVLEVAGVKPKTRPGGECDLDIKGEKQFPHRSVTYHGRRQPGSDSERSGIMHPGCKSVRVESGMVFTVADTSGA